MSNITQLFLVKLMPAVPGAVPRMASFTPAKSIVDPSTLPAGNVSPGTNFGKALELQEGDSADFFVIRHAGLYEIVVMPLDWPGGNCGSANFLVLGDDYKQVFDDVRVNYPGVPTGQMLKTTDLAIFSYSGKGILTREVMGCVETFDLNSPVYKSGVFVAIYQRDAAARGTVLFKNSSIPMQRLGGA